MAEKAWTPRALSAHMATTRHMQNLPWRISRDERGPGPYGSKDGKGNKDGKGSKDGSKTDGTKGSKDGKGFLRLGGVKPQTYEGETIIEAGELRFADTTSTPSTTEVTVNKGATLRLMGGPGTAGGAHPLPACAAALPRGAHLCV